MLRSLSILTAAGGTCLGIFAVLAVEHAPTVLLLCLETCVLHRQLPATRCQHPDPERQPRNPRMMHVQAGPTA